MSLSDIISVELATKLRELSADDFRAIVRALSLGLDPETLALGITSVAASEDFPLPSGTGGPRPLVIQAWSFCRDQKQYGATYGLSSARAGELQDLMRSDPSKGVAEIQKTVTEALRKKGSQRPVSVVLAGSPASMGGTHDKTGVSPSSRAAFKEEVRKNPAQYGMYRFEAEDTGRAGKEKFRVRLGGGLVACHTSRAGAIDVARICRVHGRRFPLIEDYVGFWLEGSNPLWGSSIPAKVTFSGQLKPSGDPPADPSAKAKTLAPSEG